MATHPVIDNRTAQEIGDLIRSAIPLYAPEWNAAKDQGNGRALVNLFSEMMESILHRLNRVPEKHFVEFLRFLGMDLLPARPARVPVTFSLVKGTPNGVFVPSGIQLAAGQTDTHAQLVFETERGFVASGAALAEAFCVDPARDAIYGYAERLRGGRDVTLFTGGGNLQRYALYVGHDTLLNLKGASEVTLRIQVVQGDLDLAKDIAWEYWADDENAPLPFTARAFRDGVILTKPEAKVEIGKTKVAGRESRWIRGTVAKPGPFVVRGLWLLVKPASQGLLPDGLFANSIPLDPSSFYPFGLTPRVSDTLSIGSAEVFCKAGAKVTVSFTLSTESTAAQDATRTFVWEYWSGAAWKTLSVDAAALNGFVRPEDGVVSVSFICPDNARPLNLNGAQSLWIRVRLSSGDFGREEFTQGASTWSMSRINVRPPLCTAIRLTYDLSGGTAGGGLPEHVVSYGCLEYEDVDAAVSVGEDLVLAEPFRDDRQGLFLGLDRAPCAGANSIFFSVVEARAGSAAAARNLSWSYWQRTTDLLEEMSVWDSATVFDPSQTPAGSELIFEEDGRTETASVLSCDAGGVITLDRKLHWRFTTNALVSRRQRLDVTDSTVGLTRRDTLEFLSPLRQSRTRLFGRACFWIMGRAAAAGSRIDPVPISAIIPDTTWASHAETARNIPLGSGTGEKDQELVLPRAPVMSAEIWVREPPTLSDEERNALDPTGLQEVRESAGALTGLWVRWTEVADFTASTRDSRHWTLDCLSGTVRFGDGGHGRVPPAGRDNIRFSCRTGGGGVGNVACGEIRVLKSSLAGIDRVENRLPAEGGADAETVQGVFERGPHLIKHRSRAVSVEDFERIAKGAVASIARTKCLVGDGRLTMYVVPRSDDRVPRPSIELKECVRETLLGCATNALTADMISVVDPCYREISVTAEIRPVSMAGTAPLEKAVVKALERYFHPLTGGDGAGWEFGRSVHLSDVYALLEAMDGVDHVASLRIGDPVPLFFWDDVPDAPSTQAILGYLSSASGLEWVRDARIERDTPTRVRVIAGAQYFTLATDMLRTRLRIDLNDTFFGILAMKTESGRVAVCQEPASIEVGSFETVCSGVHRVTVRMET
jgi:hypothetical protein